ncbi:NAD-dependent epimerase/dehydratase family protein [candidate division KSB1 bacterium]|nr:MAG: NAD-dependent epimerase/dehydratase family protein [candidate division KSB1 bacterium]
MRILVTGGAGFIGSHVAEGFLARGHNVAVLDNLSTGFRHNVPANVRLFEADIRDENALQRVFEEFRPEIIDHHAAQMDVRKSLDNPVFDAETNIVGTLKLILESVRSGVKRFIYASTGGAVYGEPKQLPVEEQHTINPECAYGISKHTVEHYLELYRILQGLKYVVLRYPNVYGPRQNPHGEAGVNAIFIGLLLEGKTPTIFGNGEHVRDYVFISDVVDANLRALERGEGQIINIGSGRGTSVNQIHEMLCHILKVDKPAHHAPGRPGEIQRVYLDARKAETVLGWKPTITFEDGLRRTVDWHKQQRVPA